MAPTPASAYEVVRDLLDLRTASPTTPPGALLGAVSGRAGPRFLIPLGWKPAAVASCLAYQGIRDPGTRARRAAVGNAIRAGADRAVVRSRLAADVGEGSLLGHLADVLGHPEIAVAVGLGRMDELWRPTLQVFDPDGEPLAFVKIGRGPVVSHLVRTEAAALDLWGQHPDPRLVVPTSLALTTWRGEPILFVAPLPPDVRRLPPGPVGAAAVRTLDEPLDPVPLGDAPWWTERRRRFAADPEISPILDQIESRHGATAHTWARWHGDWVPWNLARCHRGLVAWDWEYSEAGAPVGLDETHFAYQVAHLQHGRSVTEALATARRAAPSPWVADAHLAMLVTRAGDLALLAGQPVTDHADVLAAVTAELGR